MTDVDGTASISAVERCSTSTSSPIHPHSQVGPSESSTSITSTFSTDSLTTPQSSILPISSPNRTCSILVNKSELPKISSSHKNLESQSSFKQSLKAAFLHPPAPGKLARTDGKPLGKSFIRTKPINSREKISGGEILDRDPRGRDASVGDGVKAVELLPEEVGSENQIGESAVIDVEVGQEGDGETQSSTEKEGSIISESGLTDGIQAKRSRSISPNPPTQRVRQPSIASSTTSSRSNNTSTSSSNQSIHAIKFAPLPTSGRLKRANSITIGVAARSQLLHSQGNGRSWQSQQRQFPVPVQRNHPMQPRSNNNGNCPPNPGISQQNQRDQVYNSNSLTNFSKPKIVRTNSSNDSKSSETDGELKRTKSSLWKRMRSTSSLSSKSNASNASSSSSIPSPTQSNNDSNSSNTTVATSNSSNISLSASPEAEEPVDPLSNPTIPNLSTSEAVPDESGHATPKRPSSPHHHQHQHQHHFPGHLDLEDEEGGSRTPKTNGNGLHHPPLQRRVSTGAYLKDQSIRGMQDERRKEFIGDVQEFRNLHPDNVGFEHGEEAVNGNGNENDEGEAEERNPGVIAKWMKSLGLGGGEVEEEGGQREVKVVDPEIENQAEEGEGEGEKQEEGEETIDEEEIEAEKLAEEAFEHSKVKGVGKEKVSEKT